MYFVGLLLLTFNMSICTFNNYYFFMENYSFPNIYQNRNIGFIIFVVCSGDAVKLIFRVVLVSSNEAIIKFRLKYAIWMWLIK